MATLTKRETVAIDDLLERIQVEMREKILKRAARNAGNVVMRRAKQLAPVGDLRHRPGLDALKDTIAVKNIVYRDRFFVAVVGPTHPEGNHGHLIEDGHDVVVSRGSRKGQSPLTGSARVEGKQYMAPAGDQTQNEQFFALVNTIERAIVKQGG